MIKKIALISAPISSQKNIDNNKRILNIDQNKEHALMLAL